MELRQSASLRLGIPERTEGACHPRAPLLSSLLPLSCCFFICQDRKLRRKPAGVHLTFILDASDISRFRINCFQALTAKARRASEPSVLLYE